MNVQLYMRNNVSIKIILPLPRRRGCSAQAWIGRSECMVISFSNAGSGPTKILDHVLETSTSKGRRHVPAVQLLIFLYDPTKTGIPFTPSTDKKNGLILDSHILGKRSWPEPFTYEVHH